MVHIFHAPSGSKQKGNAISMTTDAQSVLLVDDEKMLLDVVAAACTSSGYQVRTALDGASALAELDAHPEIGLMMTDIVLTRDMDGFTLATRALQRRPGLKLLFVSGFGHHAERTPEFADARVLSKPLPLAVLRQEIGDALAGSAT